MPEGGSMKIRSRLFITAVLLMSVGLYAFVDWIVEDVRLHYFITMEESLVDTSVLLAEEVSCFASKDGITLNENFQKQIEEAAKRKLHAQIYDHTKTKMNVRVVVVDRHAIVKYDSRSKKTEGTFYNWRDVRLTLQGKYGARATYERKGDPTSFYFYVAAPVFFEGKIVGAVSVGKPLSSIMPFLQQARTRLVVSGIIAFFSILLLLIPVSLWIIHPVRALTAYARSVRDGQKVLPPKLKYGEMGELARAFEEMRDALEGREYVEEYVQSLTHEMKSPLAAIQGAAELLDEQMSPEQRTRFLKNIQTESDRLHGLVNRMLALASIEKRKEPARAEPIAIQKLINDVIDSLLPLLQEKDLNVICSIEENTTLQGEYFLLRQALVNLVQNAISFSPKGEKIKIKVFSNDQNVIIEVCDFGTGIPDYAIERVFDRFYSLPRPDGGTKSSGLGLNFVREIAHLHHGTIQLFNRSKKGTKAVLTLSKKT